MFEMFRKKKKKKPAHQLTVGLRTQLCKECHDFERRLCEVYGQPALFHRWVQGDKVLLKVNTTDRDAEIESLNSWLRDAGMIRSGCSTEVISETFALVEYPDGKVARVRPESVRFLVGEGGK